MPASGRRRNRRSTAAAVALTAGITAGAALLLSACGPNDPVADPATAPTANGSAAAAGSGSGKGSGKGADGSAQAPSATVSAKPAGSSATLNGTANNGLTISDGTRYVVMNGTRVDFGTEVRDLAWSPNGAKAVFIDGDGDLAVSDPDGGGRVIAAKNPGGQTWSHPTWQIRPDYSDPDVRTNHLIFVVRSGGVSKLYRVPATGQYATPKALSLGSASGEDAKPLPQTGNIWPNAAGNHGTSVYANSADGEVYIRDDYLRQQGYQLTQGSEPALSPTPDQLDIVFVRSVGGHDHLFVEHSADDGPVYKDLTPHATTDYTEPAWSPDGRTIAARTADGVVTLPADGSRAPVKVSGYQGLPAYRTS
ncbi:MULTISPECIES: hypothetical protein [unclassified Streptomyces]|uniref:hypothetical protein n=1 Tax=unclassified Streptomyces TaxID=2593676 RepID=UPI002E2BD487|nr:hypothetical protein [Streptomyces sp. NBC_00223]